ncbi:N-alpha-acetyltransferase 25, NatB auxiliary subunit [Octopus bimaculoides]|uniref:N-terminal acetyltransferase B complex subunit NAA25 homolog n=1 Tax=Octopus bimaculoides TaxID=37653 RepID=A0A0L8HRJ6_OCTBM|nr:N-alpha-acetyltransferase 25, NatB auxiliary subunit [Octopus bimaculoides]|eukprot:XP_014770080.1 PREDICTED: N-alpha-acetyltransferase 25, NatB auxiliary subunit-like [Octopus bimaculoides]
MASRGNVDVNERRLRTIYECLDLGNNKKAVQEADKLLKKQRDNQCAKVLKALALLHLGRDDESSCILQEVHSLQPTDEATLQGMLICYRETHQFDLIANMYENAYRARPDSEEILSALFMSYVRLGYYKKQHQTAMLLHKLKPTKNPYYFWAVMSIVMQAHTAEDRQQAKSLYLPLAERMTLKYIKEDKIEAEAEIHLYLIILKELEKWQEAIDLLQGPLGEKFTSEIDFRKKEIASLYCKLKEWSKANVAYQALLQENPDDWSFWSQYLTCVTELVKCKKDSNEEDHSESSAHCTIEKAVLFIEKLADENREIERPLRGPYLARLHLLKMFYNDNNDYSDIIGKPADLLKQYFSMFGDKARCFGDMREYITMLGDKDKSQFLTSINEDLRLNMGDNSQEFPQTVKAMQQHMTCLRLERSLGNYEHMPTEDRMSQVKDLLKFYKHGLTLGKDLLATDIQYADTYLLLAMHLLLDIYNQTGDTGVLWQIIAQLEKGLKNSPSNFQIKLLLIRLYCTVGAFGPCTDIYDSMEAKHIINDTLGYVVANHVNRLGHFLSAHMMYNTMLRFFSVNHKEITEYLIPSYKYGTFIKIHEFVQFRERLQNSLQYASAIEESLLLDLVLETCNHNSTEMMLTNMAIDPDVDRTKGEKDLQDNRDFTLLSNWDPPDGQTLKELQEKSFMEEKAWLKLHSYLLRTLIAAIYLGRQPDSSATTTQNGTSAVSKRPMVHVLRDLKQLFQQHVIDCKHYKLPIKYTIHGPYPTRISSYLLQNHHQVFLLMVEHVLYIHLLYENGFDKADEEEEKRIQTTVVSLVDGLVSKHKCSLISEENGKKTWNLTLLENLVLLAETISHITILAAVCHRILKPMKTSWVKKNKKKKELNIPQPKTFENFNNLTASLEKSTHELHKAVTDINPVFKLLNLHHLNLTESISSEEEDVAMEMMMWKRVEESYQQSAHQVTDLLHHKLEYLSSLHL